MSDCPDPLSGLPHGPEFRFVDELTILEPGQRAAGSYHIPDETGLPLLKGHFPGAPMLPGVILGEMLAQAAGALAQSAPDQPPLNNLRLTSVQALKILRPAFPGDRLEISVEIEARMGHLVQAAGSISRDGETIAKGKVTLAADPE